MVNRTFVSFDNDAMIIATGSPSGVPDMPIINNSDTPNGTIFTCTGGTGNSITVNDTNAGGASNVFGDDDRTNHIIVNGAGLVANGTQVEAESLIFVRALNALGVQVGPTITLTVFSKGGVTSDVWGFGTNHLLVSGTQYVKTGGSNTGSSNYNNFVPCFTAGTMIRLPKGTVPVETLVPGQTVWTEQGPHPLSWVGHTQVNGEGQFAPVVFDPGTIGNDQTLVVSPQHCFVV